MAAALVLAMIHAAMAHHAASHSSSHAAVTGMIHAAAIHRLAVDDAALLGLAGIHPLRRRGVMRAMVHFTMVHLAMIHRAALRLRHRDARRQQQGCSARRQPCRARKILFLRHSKPPQVFG